MKNIIKTDRMHKVVSRTVKAAKMEQKVSPTFNILSILKHFGGLFARSAYMPAAQYKVSNASWQLVGIPAGMNTVKDSELYISTESTPNHDDCTVFHSAGTEFAMLTFLQPC